MKIKEIVRALDSMAPLYLQEDYDNAGLVAGDPEKEANSCLLCVDVTPEVMQEAEARAIPLVISHHPVIFSGLKKIIRGNTQADILTMALKNDISLYSMHTNLDNIDSGVNRVLGDKLGLDNLRILRPMKDQLVKLAVFCPVSHAEQVRAAIFQAGAGVIGNYDCCSYNIEGKGSFRANERATPFVGKAHEIHFEDEIRIETLMPVYLKDQVVNAMKDAHPYEEVAYDLYPLINDNPVTGAGMLGDLPKEMTGEDLLAFLKKVLGIPCIRHSMIMKGKIKKVAVCGGSGSFLMEDAIRAEAGAFVTADLKYHQFFDATGRILLVDAGHFETEQFTVEIIARYLNDIFPTFAVHISKVAQNPVKYL
jgi:dinuclear metal center YbgI/SA1388 family protein